METLYILISCPRLYLCHTMSNISSYAIADGVPKMNTDDEHDKGKQSSWSYLCFNKNYPVTVVTENAHCRNVAYTVLLLITCSQYYHVYHECVSYFLLSPGAPISPGREILKWGPSVHACVCHVTFPDGNSKSSALIHSKFYSIPPEEEPYCFWQKSNFQNCHWWPFCIFLHKNFEMQ